MQNIQNNNTTCFHSRGQGHYGIDNGRIIGKQLRMCQGYISTTTHLSPEPLMNIDIIVSTINQ